MEKPSVDQCADQAQPSLKLGKIKPKLGCYDLLLLPLVLVLLCKLSIKRRHSPQKQDSKDTRQHPPYIAAGEHASHLLLYSGKGYIVDGFSWLREWVGL